MTSRQAQFQEDTYFRVMKLVQAQPDISQRQLAQTLGLSLGGINYCLQALMQKGWVKAHNFSSTPNKLSYAYLLTPTGITEKTALTTRFLKRKMAEYEHLQAEIAALQLEVSGERASEDCARDLTRNMEINPANRN
jgi:EPS-associated MarR family transcriptional regulator